MTLNLFDRISAKEKSTRQIQACSTKRTEILLLFLYKKVVSQLLRERELLPYILCRPKAYALETISYAIDIEDFREYQFLSAFGLSVLVSCRNY